MVRATRLSAAVAAMLGAALLLAGPGSAEARQEGKWWTPRSGNGHGGRAERVYRRRSAPRAFTRQYRSWGGRRVYRDMIVIRNVNRGPRYRAWRTYCPPEYIYSRRIIRVRPVRFYVAAGGPRFYGGYHDDDCLYGCNFCQARFGSYSGYHQHVNSCSHRPHGYRVESSDWDAGPGHGWQEKDWRDQDGDSYGAYDREYDRDYDPGQDRDWRDDELDDDYDR